MIVTNCRRRRAVIAAVLMAAAFTPLTAAEPPAPPAKKNPLLKLVEPWPSPEARAQRRLDTEARPLFASAEPLLFTLAADIKALNKDRDPASKRRYPGELRLPGEGGRQVTLPVRLSAPAPVRRIPRPCDYVPLRVQSPNNTSAGTRL